MSPQPCEGSPCVGQPVGLPTHPWGGEGRRKGREMRVGEGEEGRDDVCVIIELGVVYLLYKYNVCEEC